jgi:hypothetical protein
MKPPPCPRPGPTARRRAKKRARTVGALARLCRCGRRLVTHGETCGLCASGKTPPRVDPEPVSDPVPESAAEQLDAEPADQLVDHPPPEPASILEPPPAVRRPAPGADPAGATLRCRGCGHRFGRRATAVVFGPPDVEAPLAVCQGCATDPARHRAVFPGCPRPHSARDHGGQRVTIARARQAQALAKSAATISANTHHGRTIAP